MGYKGRDVEVISLSADQCLVAACDSCGAIGSKEFDLIKVSPYIVGRFTTRVALLEVLTVGASPQLLTAAIVSEPDPTGMEIIKGVKDELNSFQLRDLPIAISTEKNFPTRQTGLGVSVVGLSPKNNLRIATSQPGDFLYCLGLPKVGAEIQSPEDPRIIQNRHLQKLLGLEMIHDIIPVGSKGIRGEAELLMETIQGHLSLEPGTGIDLTKSAGPATCLLITVPSPLKGSVCDSLPCYQIGRILSKSNDN